jgi:hypothetical protein
MYMNELVSHRAETYSFDGVVLGTKVYGWVIK